MRIRTDENPLMVRIVTAGLVTTITPTRKRLVISDIETVFAVAIQQIELGRRHIILDFSEVEWVCASTAGFLVELNRRLQKLEGSLKLRGVCEEMHQVLRMMHVEDRFEILGSAVPLRNAG